MENAPILTDHYVSLLRGINQSMNGGAKMYSSLRSCALFFTSSSTT